MKWAFISAALLLCGNVQAASEYDPLINYIALQHGEDPAVLRAIAAQESRKNPWTFNADGEPFQYGDKETAVNALWSLTKAPWMVKFVQPDKKMVRRFFSNLSDAQIFQQAVQQMRSAHGNGLLLVRLDDSKEVRPGEIRIRPLRLINTDIGIAQVNYRWNGQGVATVQQWFDPTYNLTFAAKRIAELKKKHGSDLAAVGYYHSSTDAARKRYLASYMQKYNEEKRNASASFAIRH